MTTNAPRKATRNYSQMTASQRLADEDDCSVDNQIVFCVKAPDVGQSYDSEEVRNINELFELLTEAGIEPVWITPQEALKVSSKDHNFYILPAFRGKVFDHLNAKQVKTVGSSLVKDCLSEGVPLPKWSHPIYCNSLKSTIISFTGLSKERREELTSKVLWMNGKVSKTLITSVTHVVADKCVSNNPKYKVCRRLRLPVMSSKWIDDAWNKSLVEGTMDYTATDVIQEYMLKIFSQYVIVTSGIAGQDRMDIGRLIELHGGKAPGDMQRGLCTHLLTDNIASQKYRKAREWKNITIAHPRWLRRSVQDGYVLDESQFDPALSRTTSAPVTSTQHPNAAPPPADLEFSSIMDGSLQSRKTNSSMNLNVTFTNDVSRVDKTTTPQTMPRTKMLRKESSRNFNITMTSSDPIDTVIEEIQRGDFDFFEGLMFWLCGVEEKNVEKWKRVLDRCGATRVASSVNATHIVVIKMGMEKSNLLKSRSKGVDVVTADWIVESVKKKELLPTDDYQWNPDLNGTTNKHQSQPTTSRQTDQQQQQQSDFILPTPPPAINTFTTGACVASNEQNKINHRPLHSQSDDYLQQNLFSAKTFRFCGLHEDVSLRLKKEIPSAGGSIVSDDTTNASYLVCNSFDFGDLVVPSLLLFDQVVTETWIKSCLTKLELVPVMSHPLFRPLPAVRNSGLFNNKVFGLIGLDGIDKAFLGSMIVEFGGHVETSIVSKPRGNLKPCTHLVAGTQSTKLEECKKKIPTLVIVDPSWLIESVINNECPDEAEFPFVNKAYSDYVGRADRWWTGVPTVDDVEEEGGDEVRLEDSAVEIDDMPPTPIYSHAPPPKTPSNNENAFKPKLRLSGVTQIIDAIPSPQPSDQDTSMGSSLSISKIGKILSAAAVRTEKEPIFNDKPLHSSFMFRKPTVEDSFVDEANLAKPSTSKSDPPPTTAQPSTSRLDTSHQRKMNEELQKMKEWRNARKIQEAEQSSATSGNGSRAPNKRRCFDLPDDSPFAKRKPVEEEEPMIQWMPDASDEVVPLSSRVYSLPSVGQQQPPSKVSSTEPRAAKKALNFEPIQPLKKLEDDIDKVSMQAIASQMTIDMTSRGSENMKSLPKVPCPQSSSRRPLSQSNGETEMPPQKKFMFSTLAQEERLLLERLIVKLGGSVFKETTNVPDDSTHLVCGKIVRGTKLMGCIASGKFVVPPDYVKKSAEAGKWLDEEDYVWSNPSIMTKYKLGQRETSICLAARRWREKIHKSFTTDTPIRGAFEGWRVLLYATQAKADGLIPLLEAGKAIVQTRSSIHTLEEFQPTVAVACGSKDWQEDDLQYLSRTGAKLFKLDFIANHLLLENVIEAEYIHDEFLHLFKSV